MSAGAAAAVVTNGASFLSKVIEIPCIPRSSMSIGMFCTHEL